MAVFENSSFDHHEAVAFHADAATRLRAIIAIHNTARGPSVGGCRMWPFGNEEEAVTDALRLSRGMSYKSALAGLPFEESVVARATLFAFPGDVQLLTCSAEDLIVLKAFAARGQDWVDIEGIIVRQTGTLDWSYVDKHLSPLAALKEAPEIMDELARRRAEFER